MSEVPPRAGGGEIAGGDAGGEPRDAHERRRRGLPFHCTVETGTKPLPVTVRVKAAPPAPAVVGLMMLRVAVIEPRDREVTRGRPCPDP
jgi:hypothetical protein